MPFVFYDTETTGTQTAFDQILQFGAIKTDDDLNEIDRFEIRGRLQPHVVPSPGALLVTGITPELLLDPNLPTHYEMVRQIAERMRTWGAATYIGHYSIEFDENILRHAFFQTLHPICATNTGGNVRGDALNILRGLHVNHPNTIAVPINAKGNPTFSLAQIAPANGYAHENAHDAMADVEATIFMCRLVKERRPDFWRAMMATMSKRDVEELCDRSELVRHTTMYFGRFYSHILKYIGNADGTLVGFDISHNPDDFMGATDAEIINQIEDQPKVIRKFYSNENPILISMTADDAAVTLEGIPADEIRRRVAALKKNDEYSNSVLRIVEQLDGERRVEAEGPIYLEDRIHEGFPSRTDYELMRQFQATTDWGARTAIGGCV